MPYLKIQTNIEVDAAERVGLLAKTSEAVAKALGKPEGYVMVALQDAQSMLFAGNDDPLAFLELKSIGLPQSRTGELSAALCELVSAQMGIAPERIYIEFSDAARSLWGWDGRTF